jgi:hypothetical protein
MKHVGSAEAVHYYCLHHASLVLTV